MSTSDLKFFGRTYRKLKFGDLGKKFKLLYKNCVLSNQKSNSRKWISLESEIPPNAMQIIMYFNEKWKHTF